MKVSAKSKDKAQTLARLIRAMMQKGPMSAIDIVDYLAVSKSASLKYISILVGAGVSTVIHAKKVGKSDFLVISLVKDEQKIEDYLKALDSVQVGSDRPPVYLRPGAYSATTSDMHPGAVKYASINVPSWRDDPYISASMGPNGPQKHYPDDSEE